MCYSTSQLVLFLVIILYVIIFNCVKRKKEILRCNHACCTLCLFLVLSIYFVICASVVIDALFYFITNLQLNMFLFVCIVTALVVTVENKLSIIKQHV